MDLICWMPLPTGIDLASLPDLAHYRSQGIDRIVARYVRTPIGPEFMAPPARS